jgi:hypothetical protein
MRFRPVRFLIGVLFVTVPYTALIGINENLEQLKTWRLIGAALVVLAFLSCEWKAPPLAKVVSATLLLFDGYICLQPFFFERAAESTDILFIGSIFIVTSLMLVSILLASNDRSFVLRCLTASIVITCAYQYWQIVAWRYLGEGWVIVLNDRNQVDLIGFFRLVADYFGAPGFMGESAQMAMFIGPGAGILLLARHYKLYPSARTLMFIVVASLIATLSIGGVIYLMMLLVIQISIVGSRHIATRKRIVWLGGIGFVTGSAVALSLVTPQLLEFFQSRWYDVSSGTSDRQLGAAAFYDLLQVNPWFGYGFASYRELSAQPSHFVTTLTDHGIIGAVLLVTVWVVPLLCACWRSRYRLFAIPYLTSLIHMMLAYGTFQWPGLWINLGLALFLMQSDRLPIRIALSRQVESQDSYLAGSFRLPT